MASLYKEAQNLKIPGRLTKGPDAQAGCFRHDNTYRPHLRMGSGVAQSGYVTGRYHDCVYGYQAMLREMSIMQTSVNLLQCNKWF